MTRRSPTAADTKSSRTFTKKATMVFGGSDILIAILGVATGYAATPDLIEKLAFGQAMFLIAYQTVGVLDHRISKNLDGISTLVSAILGRRKPE